MSIELSFGGATAWAYQKLSDNLTHKLNIAFGIKSKKIDDIPVVPLNKNEEIYLIVNEDLIDLSSLDFLSKKIKGLGRSKALRLLQTFGSLDNIKKADVAEIQKVKGIGKKMSERIMKLL